MKFNLRNKISKKTQEFINKYHHPYFMAQSHLYIAIEHSDIHKQKELEIIIQELENLGYHEVYDKHLINYSNNKLS